METCSNCGATNRESAKFCTSCGVRLPTLARRSTTDWDRSGRESSTAATVTTTLEPTSTASETDASARATDAGDGATPADADAPQTWSWNEPTTSDARETEAPASDVDAQETTGDDVSGQATGDDTDASTGGPASDTSSTLSHWASQWTGEYASAPEADGTRGTSGDLPAAEATPETGQSDDGASAADRSEEATRRAANEAAWQAAIAEPVDVPSGNYDATAMTQSDEPSYTDSAIETSSADAGAEDQADTAPTVAAGDQGGSLARARELLDELQRLLPVLATPAASPASAGGERAEGVGAEGTSGLVADELAAARAEGFDTTDLRRALEAAQGRPRDVDTMLDLVGRIEPMLAALDAHDRLVAAVDRALSQLGQPGGEASSAGMQGQEQDQERGESGRFSWRTH